MSDGASNSWAARNRTVLAKMTSGRPLGLLDNNVSCHPQPQVKAMFARKKIPAISVPGMSERGSESSSQLPPRN